MLKKNIYIIFPAGYMGNYINWIINISDTDTCKTTIKNPLTETETTHNFIRKPTHLPFLKMVCWQLYNKPTDKRVYLINHLVDEKTSFMFPNAAATIAYIYSYDPDAIVIHLNDNNEEDITKYGAINMIKKWPVFLKLRDRFHPDEYRPFDDSDEQHARNWLVDCWKAYFGHNPPIDRARLLNNLTEMSDWFDIRHELAPDEITRDNYITHTTIPEHCYEINIKNIISPNFIDIISNILSNTNSGDYNFAYARSFHDNFIEAQTNKKWFTAINNYRKLGTIDSWLGEHILTQAFLISEANNLPENWRGMNFNEICKHISN